MVKSSETERKERMDTSSLMEQILTAELLHTLIEKILVHKTVKGEDDRRGQEVEIFYRFIGKID